jgi:rhodanese-related sulfurtransferase
MKKNITALLFFISFFVSAFSLEAVAHTDISVPDANAMITSGMDLIVLDVRELSEYCGSLGHIAGARNYPWNSNYLQTHYTDIPIDANIIVVCQSGGRSNAAATFLYGKGYTHIYDMLGGTSSWVNTYGYNTVGCVDSDGDGFNDDLDNCPSVYNPSQTDTDGDHIGNACDFDCPNLDLTNPVNFADFAVLANNWLKAGENLLGDLNLDGVVNNDDLFKFSQYWLVDCYE